MLYFFLVILAVHHVLGYNFLVYSPLFATSHTNYLASIADTLTIAGHNVTFFVPIMHSKQRDKTLVRYTKDVVKVEVSPEVDNQYENFINGPLSDLWSLERGYGLAKRLFTEYNSIANNHCIDLGARNDWKEKLRRQRFDVFIYEPISFCGQIIRRYLNISTVIAAPSVAFDVPTMRAIGEPFFASMTPVAMSLYSDEMSISERIMNYLMYHWHPGFSEGPVRPEVFKSFDLPVFDLPEALSETSFIFTQANQYLDFPRPTLPRTVLIGGITINMTDIRSKTLSKELDQVLNKRNKTVYISFGSVVRSKDMPIEYRTILLSVCRSFPEVTFLWKYEDDDVTFADGIENIYFSKWFPQTALLADRRLSAMLTHGGLGSTMELAYLGVPAVTVPIFADQTRNSRMLARHGGSINMKKLDLGSYNVLYDAVKDILYQPNYYQNAKLLSEVLNSQPFKPSELVVRHAELAARFKNIPQLDAASAKLTFVELYLLDAVFIGFISIASLLTVIVVSVTKCLVVVSQKLKRE